MEREKRERKRQQQNISLCLGSCLSGFMWFLATWGLNKIVTLKLLCSDSGFHTRAPYLSGFNLTAGKLDE